MGKVVKIRSMNPGRVFKTQLCKMGSQNTRYLITTLGYRYEWTRQHHTTHCVILPITYQLMTHLLKIKRANVYSQNLRSNKKFFCY